MGGYRSRSKPGYVLAVVGTPLAKLPRNPDVDQIFTGRPVLMNSWPNRRS